MARLGGARCCLPPPRVQEVRYKVFILPGTAATNAATFVMMTLSKYPERLAVPGCKLVAGQQRARTHSSRRGAGARALRIPFEFRSAAAQNTPLNRVVCGTFFRLTVGGLASKKRFCQKKTSVWQGGLEKKLKI